MIEISPIISAIIAMLVCWGLGYIIIPYLHKLKFGQTILDIGPKWHVNKQGTPTMGGVMIFGGVVLGVLCAFCYSLFTNGRFATELSDKRAFLRFIAGVGLALGMGLIGFLDDYIKVVKKRNLGLTAKQKTFGQFLVSAIYLAALYFSGMQTTWLPFIGEVSVVSGIGIIFWPISLFFIYGFTNAVNLTDGVDGLAASVTMIVSCSFMFIAGFVTNISYNTLAAAFAGACAGFLLWNANPAKVFMGDTGSMFLGGSVVAFSFGVGKPILLILAGLLYIIEAFSVILQVFWVTKFGRRIFKMSPIHHHFELSGWNEGKIVFVFSLFTFGCCVLAILPVILNL